MQIEPYQAAHLDAVVGLSLRAWAPVFASIEAAMDRDTYLAMHPDWRVTQREAVEAACADADMEVWVAIEDAQVAGFTALRQHAEDKLGEIYMIAVDPPFHRRGIAKALIHHSVDRLTKAGMSVAMIDTGGDPGHAPARRAYESTGFRALPCVRYFKKL